MARRRRGTVASVTIERAGFREGGKVLTFMLEWWLVHHELGEEPHIEQVAEWWGYSRDKVYQGQRRFRETWPEVSNPSGLAAIIGIDLTGEEVPAPFTAHLPRGVLGT